MTLKQLSALYFTLFIGVTMANPIEDFKQVGAAKLEIFFFDIYHSQLYSETGQYQEGEYPLALNIQYLRDIDASDLVDRTEQEWQKLGFEDEQISPWLTLITSLWPDIKKGDTLLLVVEPDLSSTFYFNQKLLAKIEEPSFGQNFLAIWLDKNCSYPKLRKKLIGK